MFIWAPKVKHHDRVSLRKEEEMTELTKHWEDNYDACDAESSEESQHSKHYKGGRESTDQRKAHPCYIWDQ